MSSSRPHTQRRPHGPHAATPRRPGDAGAALAWVLVAAAALAAVALVVFLVFSQLAQETSDDVAVPEVREGSLEIEDYEAVELGTPKDEVLSALRPALPVDTRIVDRYEGRSPENVAAECVYYERYGGRAGESFRFCFDEDVLADKSVLLAGDPGADSEIVDEPS